jgi:glycerol-3-phosphate acyltransferase PlsY
MSPVLLLLACTAGGYLLGSIPFGLLLTRAAGLGDIRAIGSGNIGATNVLRTGKRWLAGATLVLDGAKGAAALLIANYLIGDAQVSGALVVSFGGLLAGLGAMLGHVYPVWLRFRGGKGVATGLGLLLAAMWPVGVACCVLWLLAARLTRISSAAALTAFIAAPLLAGILAVRAALPWPSVGFALAVSCLVLSRHRGNIARLRAGLEPRIGANR